MTSESALLESVQRYMLDSAISLLCETNRELISNAIDNAIDDLSKFLSEPQTRIFTISKVSIQGNFCFYYFIINLIINFI